MKFFCQMNLNTVYLIKIVIVYYYLLDSLSH